VRENLVVYWALPLIFAVALALRIVGIAPHEDRPDEGNFIAPAARVLAGELVPNHFFYPPFSHYVNACGYGLLFAGGLVTGAWSSPGEFREHYFADHAPFLATLRIITALWGALACVLAYAIGRLLGLRPRAALVPAALVALLPVHVLWSHVAKSDVPMATAFLAFVAACLWVARLQRFWSGAVLLGLAAALPLSFKQNAAFFMVLPFLLLAAQLTGPHAWPPRKTIRFLALSVGVGAVTWCILNIGAVLDLRNFLEFQALQSQMQRHAETPFGAALLTVKRLASGKHGLGAAIFLAFVASLFLVRQAPFVVLWLTPILGMFALAMIIGPRIRNNIMLPATALATCLAGVALARWCSVRSPKLRILGWAAATLVFLFAGMATVARVVELVSPSSSDRASALVAEISERDTRILSGAKLTLRPSLEALVDAHHRDDRLARKYDVELPPRAREREQAAGGHHYITKMPFATGGMEFASDEDAQRVKPFAWPIQDEEWHLDYWLDRGYTVFVVSDETFFLECDVPAYVRLHGEIRDRCGLLAELPDSREHVTWDYEVKVYQCAPDRDPLPVTHPAS
jgi:hypothetical protein